MSTRRKAPGKQSPAAPNGSTPSPESPAAPPRRKSSTRGGVERAIDECIGAICLAEVALHSLESQDIAFPEQEVLKRALKAMWIVHDWMVDLPPDTPEGQAPDTEDLNESLNGEDESP